MFNLNICGFDYNNLQEATMCLLVLGLKWHQYQQASVDLDRDETQAYLDKDILCQKLRIPKILQNLTLNTCSLWDSSKTSTFRSK